MIDTSTNDIGGQPLWGAPERLKQIMAPPLGVLRAAIDGCSDDEATRTAATTALVLGLWQLRGRALTPTVPSLLLASPGSPDDDPVDALTRELVYREEEDRPTQLDRGYGPVIDPANAAHQMDVACDGLDRLEPKLRGSHTARQEAQKLQALFHQAMASAFGLLRCRPYAGSWHPTFALLTGPGDEIILRLNQDEDREAFVTDVDQNLGRLSLPVGPGQDASPVDKHLSLSGAVGSEEAEAAAWLASSGEPVFLLPHLATRPLTLTNMPALRYFASQWRDAPTIPVQTATRLPSSDWILPYQAEIRRRLAVLPYEYGFAAQQAIHQLEGVCERITLYARREGEGLDELAALTRRLYAHTLRGMVLSMAGLAWFGHGIYLEPGSEPLRDKASTILAKLHEKGPMSLTTCMKNHHLSAKGRDALLACLADEGLLRVEGKQIVATTYPEFVGQLYRREGLPPVADYLV